MEHEGDDYTNHDWCFRYSNKRVIKKTGGFGSQRTSGDQPNYSNAENGQNTEKSSGDLRTLAVTKNPVKDLQVTLIWKTLKEIIWIYEIVNFIILLISIQSSIIDLK